MVKPIKKALPKKSTTGLGLNKPKQTKQQDTAASKKDLTRAKQLYEALLTNRKIMRQPKMISWAVWFKRIRAIFTSQELDATLDWYCANIGRKGVPYAYSAESFHDRFPVIFDLMQSEKDKTPIVYNGKIGVNAKRLFSKLQHWHWPKGSVDQLEVAIQISLDNLDAFIAKLQTVHRRMTKGWNKIFDASEDERNPPASQNCKEYRLKEYTLSILSMRLADPMRFTEYWYQDFFDRVYEWHNWDGIIKPIDTSSKLFAEEMMDVGTRFHGDHKLWALLKEELN